MGRAVHFMTQYLSSTQSWIAIAVLVLLLLPIIKWVLWKLFSFDHRVKKILFQKKSSEVRLGKMVESIAPLLDGFPVDVNKPGTSTVFIGQPIDFLYIDPDEGVVFVEVKSGDAKLSGVQKRIKALIQEGRVSWKEFRFK